MDASHHIVVVGCSLAGLRTLEALRREGWEGRITAIGDEPHMPYDRPPLSKQFLKGDWDEDKLALRRQPFEDLGVEWRLGERAAALDTASREITLESGDRLSWDGLVIATGTVPKRLPFGDDLEGIHLLRTLDDARALRKDLEGARRVVVVGAGFIGMEVAATCRQRGLEVAVAEFLETPLVRGLGPVLGQYVGDVFAERGVAIHCGVGVEGFDGSGRVESVRLSDGAALEADVVVVGIGVAPATDWLAGSGLEIDDGVVCDATGATAVPGVVAVGDVARWKNPLYGRHLRMEHWTSAVEQSGIAAARLLGGSPTPLAQVPYVWSDQFEMRIAIGGEVAEGDDMHVCHGSLEEGRFVALFGRNDKLTGAVGFRRPRQLMAARKLIGEGASFAAAIEANAG